MRRVLFDENVLGKLRRDLSEFLIRTAQEQGWSAYRNGELLKRAAAEFDVLVTMDQRMRFQQNMSQLALGFVVIDIRDSRLVHVRTLLNELREAIASVPVGQVVVVARQAR